MILNATTAMELLILIGPLRPTQIKNLWWVKVRK